jgi:hypothetical protein
MDQQVNLRWVCGAAATWCIVLALVEFDAGWVYQLSRWGLCAAAGWAAFTLRGWRRWALAVVAVLFNPIALIGFEEEEWRFVDWVSATAFFGVHLRKSSFRWLLWCRRNFELKDYFGVLMISTFVAVGIYTALHPIQPPTKEELEAKKKAEMDRIMNTLDPGREERAQKQIWREQEAKSAQLRERLNSHPSFYQAPPK